ncbi:hypothetical protein KBC79_02920 [Candidatus Woesebacteria bacterium]|nr:hypothetical protein [Candidatus Woesebacteria bacterium]
MQILKEKYSAIPNSVFESQDIDLIFDHYCDEFLKDNDSEINFVMMFLNIIRDFTYHKIDEKTLSTLIHKSLFDHRTKKYHYEPHLWSINDVLSLMHELLDITWTKDSSEYQDYKKELDIRLTTLVEKYQESNR